MKKYLMTFIKGFVIGFCMLVPGVSGGTIAVLFGIYRDLLTAVSTFFKNIKQNFLFLFALVIGAIPGFYLSSLVLGPLLERFPTIIPFLFCGIVLAGIPFLWKKAEIKKIEWKHLIGLFGGALFILAIMLLPELGITFSPDMTNGIDFKGIIFLLIAGFFIVLSMTLPGFSTSHVLLIFGIYEPFLNAISNLDFAFLIPIAISVVVGIFLITKGIDYLFKKYTQIMYCIIMGFVATSIVAIITIWPVGIDWLYSIILFVIGLVGTCYILFKFDK